MVENYLDTQKLYSRICEYKNNSEKDKFSFFLYNPLIRRYSLHGKPQFFWVCYVQEMVAIPAPHSGLLPNPGVLRGAAGVGLSHDCGGVLHGPQGWPWWVLSHGCQGSLTLLGISEPRRNAPHGAGSSPGQRQWRDVAEMGHGWAKRESCALGGGGVHGGHWEDCWGEQGLNVPSGPWHRSHKSNQKD